MNNKVVYMTHFVDKEVITRLFTKFANRYGKIWTARLDNGGDWNICADDWLEELSKFDLNVLREGVNTALDMYKEYPPTLGQLISLCLKTSGVPTGYQVIRMMTAKDFSHPVVKMMYEKIGSWKMANGSDKEISQLIREHYETIVNFFKNDPKSCWERLISFNERLKELPDPDKIPNEEERRGFKERIDEYQKLSDEIKESIKDKKIKEFDHSKIKKGSRNFDQLLFSEYKDYLINVPENLVLTIPVQDAYARLKFLSMIDQHEQLKNLGYIPPNEREGFKSLKASDRNSKPTKIYKTWNNY